MKNNARWYLLLATLLLLCSGTLATNSATSPEETPFPKSSKPVLPNADRGEKMQAAIAAQNVPIAFWGKVVDEKDLPMSGVEIIMETREWSVSPLLDFEGIFREHKKTNGVDGLFQITDAKGDVLTIKSLKKEGFQASPKSLRSFGYNISTNHIPDPTSPVIFKMWKIGTPESLLSASKFFNNLIPDGRYYTFDLLKGTLDDGPGVAGDVLLRVTRPAGASRGDRYSWSLDVRVPSGGLFETDDASAFVVPEFGYAPEYSFSMSESERIWRVGVKKAFFIKSRGGQLYGSLSIDVHAFYQGKAAVGLKYTVNPAGSRNLQPGGPRLAPASN